jgi:hypothetical protein
MNRYPYLRAYMAGVLLPSWFLLAVVIIGLGIIGIELESPAVVERIIIFAMAVVPNLWGLWNMLYVGMGMKRRLPLGVWGALLPLLIIPMGVALTRSLDVRFMTPTLVLEVAPVAIGAYFLIWKFIVAFFNRVVGLD